MTPQQTHHDLSNTTLLEGLRAHLQPLAGDARQYDGLLALIGSARFALLGEASHGTHEFYRERAEITKRLITEKGFTAVAVEADWPDAWRVNRYVRGLSDDADADAALSGFQRFPAWRKQLHYPFQNGSIVDSYPKPDPVSVKRQPRDPAQLIESFPARWAVTLPVNLRQHQFKPLFLLYCKIYAKTTT